MNSDKFLYLTLGALTVAMVALGILSFSAQHEVRKQRPDAPAPDGLQVDTSWPANQQLLQQPADSSRSTGQNPAGNPQQPAINLQPTDGADAFLQLDPGGELQ